MIDTNLIVRLIAYDIPELAHKAEAMIEAYEDAAIRFPLYVLTEVVYVLAYNPHYEYDRERINKSLSAVVAIPQFNLNRSIARQALDIFGRTKLDFVDCLLLAECSQMPCQLLTFDKQLAKECANAQALAANKPE